MHFITPPSARGLAYPLLKWRKEFKRDGIDLAVGRRPSKSRNGRADIVFLNSTYYRSFYPTNDAFFNGSRQTILDDFQALRQVGSKIVWYDQSDAASTRQLWPIKYVDLFLKRQVLRDKSSHSEARERHKLRPWVDEDPHFGDVCGQSDLARLQVGWNLGYNDYHTTNRWLSRLNVQSFKNPRVTSPRSPRPFFTSFRGGTGGSRASQRNKLRTLLESRNDPQIITGGRLARRQFLDELRRCQVVVSPFGWGEICYRDYEAFLAGALLIKPSIEHLNTFPESFYPGKTYLPCRWDLSDLPDVLDQIKRGDVEVSQIAERGQEMFVEQQGSYRLFSDHLKSLLGQVIG